MSNNHNKDANTRMRAMMAKDLFRATFTDPEVLETMMLPDFHDIQGVCKHVLDEVERAHQKMKDTINSPEHRCKSCDHCFADEEEHPLCDKYMREIHEVDMDTCKGPERD